MLQYQNTDIQKLAEDLVVAINNGNATIDAKAYTLTITDNVLELENVQSFSVQNIGSTNAYFINEPEPDVELQDQQIIEPEFSLNFGGPFNNFPYVKFFAPELTAILIITYTLKS